jgi:hypothetical protein
MDMIVLHVKLEENAYFIKKDIIYPNKNDRVLNRYYQDFNNFIATQNLHRFSVNAIHMLDAIVWIEVYN